MRDACTCTSLADACDACAAYGASPHGRAPARRGSTRSRLHVHHAPLVAAYQQGATLHSLAQRYQVCPATVHLYLKGQGVWTSRRGWNQHVPRRDA